jgi:hypothetical protein
MAQGAKNKDRIIVVKNRVRHLMLDTESRISEISAIAGAKRLNCVIGPFPPVRRSQ